MAANYLNEIILIFLQRNTNELSVDDLSAALRTNSTPCSAEEIRQIVQTLGSSLFRLQYNEEKSTIVRTQTKVTLLNLFLILQPTVFLRSTSVTIILLENVLLKKMDVIVCICVLILVVVIKEIAIFFMTWLLVIIEAL